MLARTISNTCPQAESHIGWRHCDAVEYGDSSRRQQSNTAIRAKCTIYKQFNIIRKLQCNHNYCCQRKCTHRNQKQPPIQNTSHNLNLTVDYISFEHMTIVSFGHKTHCDTDTGLLHYNSKTLKFTISPVYQQRYNSGKILPISSQPDSSAVLPVNPTSQTLCQSCQSHLNSQNLLQSCKSHPNSQILLQLCQSHPKSHTFL